MTLIYMVNIGDTEIVGRGNPSLDPHDEMPWHYTVTFTDVPTQETQTLHCNNEMHCINVLVWWLDCDENAEHHAALTAYQLGKKFLP